MRGLESILKEHAFFKHLKEDAIKFIAGCGSNVVFQPGEVIAHTGESADHFYLIREGKIAIQIYAPEKGAITVQTVGSDDILGWSWLFPPYQWSFDLKVIEKTRAIAMDGKCLREKCESDHELGFQLMKKFSYVMVKRLEATRMQILDIYQAPKV